MSITASACSAIWVKGKGWGADIYMQVDCAGMGRHALWRRGQAKEQPPTPRVHAHALSAHPRQQHFSTSRKPECKQRTLLCIQYLTSRKRPVAGMYSSWPVGTLPPAMPGGAAHVFVVQAAISCTASSTPSAPCNVGEVGEDVATVELCSPRQPTAHCPTRSLEAAARSCITIPRSLAHTWPFMAGRCTTPCTAGPGVAGGAACAHGLQCLGVHRCLGGTTGQ